KPRARLGLQFAVLPAAVLVPLEAVRLLDPDRWMHVQVRVVDVHVPAEHRPDQGKRVRVVDQAERFRAAGHGAELVHRTLGGEPTGFPLRGVYAVDGLLVVRDLGLAERSPNDQVTLFLELLSLFLAHRPKRRRLSVGRHRAPSTRFAVFRPERSYLRVKIETPVVLKDASSRWQGSAVQYATLCAPSRGNRAPLCTPCSFAVLSTGGPSMYDVVHEANTVVVGAGAAGCVLAARLSEDPARRVVLIEAGPDYPTLDQLPEDLRDGWRSAGSHDWALRDEATGAAVARARVVGGCSATNGTIALRGTVRDFDGWAARGNPGWSYAEVLPAFRKLEDDHDFVDRWHGQGGPLPIRRYRAKELTTVNAAAYEAAAQVGFPEVADHNRPGTTGLGHAPVNAFGGVRMSVAMTYLAQARGRPNLVLLADALVDRVLIHDQRAVGVLLADGRIVRADRVVLAAGTYGSPAILLRSGVG